MGSEVVCQVRYANQVSQGRALLETAELVFRGDFRLKVPFTLIDRLEVDDGDLRVGFRGETAIFSLGAQASAWAEKIRSPRGLLDKLGVKPGMAIAVVGVRDQGFISQLSARPAVVRLGAMPGPETDLIFYAADLPAELDRLPELRATLKPGGAIWVVSPKGRGSPVRDTDVMAAAKAAGLVDTKVVSFSPTHTALKLVVPVAQRRA